MVRFLKVGVWMGYIECMKEYREGEVCGCVGGDWLIVFC